MSATHCPLSALCGAICSPQWPVCNSQSAVASLHGFGSFQSAQVRLFVHFFLLQNGHESAASHSFGLREDKQVSTWLHFCKFRPQARKRNWRRLGHKGPTSPKLSTKAGPKAALVDSLACELERHRHCQTQSLAHEQSLVANSGRLCAATEPARGSICHWSAIAATWPVGELES